MSIGVIPVNTQGASWEVVRYALAIFMFISLCTLMSFVALRFLFRPSSHTGAPYDRIGSIAPVYIIRRTSCLSPQLILAEFESVWMIFMHFAVMLPICWLKLKRLSMVIPKYFTVSSCCNFCLLRKILISRLISGFFCYYHYFRFLVVKSHFVVSSPFC